MRHKLTNLLFPVDMGVVISLPVGCGGNSFMEPKVFQEIFVVLKAVFFRQLLQAQFRGGQILFDPLASELVDVGFQALGMVPPENPAQVILIELEVRRRIGDLDGPIAVAPHPLLHGGAEHIGRLPLHQQLHQQDADVVVGAFPGIFRRVGAMEQLFAENLRPGEVLRLHQLRRQRLCRGREMQPVKRHRLLADPGTAVGNSRPDVQHVSRLQLVGCFSHKQADGTLQHHNDLMAVQNPIPMPPRSRRNQSSA